MRNKHSSHPENPKIGVIGVQTIIAAALGLAITFTLSCGGGGGGSDSEPESSSGAALPSSSSAGEPMGFCVYQESSLCLPGPFTSCPGSGGLLSNSCPSSSSVAASSSGTALPSSSSAGEPMAFCVYTATSLCLSGPYISCPGSGGLLSNSCPWVSSSSSAPVGVSSSSAPAGVSSSSTNTFTDGHDGKVYKKVTIGTQTWMAQNLNRATAGSKCYNNDETNCATYGRLYDWATAMTACPDDWHLPTAAEWATLTNFAGGAETAGTKLKAASGWAIGNGMDNYGFSALPGGIGYSGGSSFSDGGSFGNWWSATDDAESGRGDNNAYRLGIGDHEGVVDDSNDKDYLNSVRCIQNSPGTFKDSRDGRVYGKATIGTQTWMKQNLNYAATDSKCYNDSIANCKKYGRLYDWAAAMALAPTYNSALYSAAAKHKGICPSGWHIPSDAEWTTLTNFAGGAETAGTKLKAESGWNSYGGVPAGMDSYGFSALPGGGYSVSGSFVAGDGGLWWSASEGSSNAAYFRVIGYSIEYVGYDSNPKGDLFSVRCLQD